MIEKYGPPLALAGIPRALMPGERFQFLLRPLQYAGFSTFDLQTVRVVSDLWTTTQHSTRLPCVHSHLYTVLSRKCRMLEDIEEKVVPRSPQKSGRYHPLLAFWASPTAATPIEGFFAFLMFMTRKTCLFAQVDFPFLSSTLRTVSARSRKTTGFMRNP